MKKMKYTLTEVKRSVSRAEKLLNYIYKKQKNRGNDMTSLIPKDDDGGDIAREKMDDLKLKDDRGNQIYGYNLIHRHGKFQKVPIHKITTDQETVGYSNVTQKLHDKDKKNDPRIPYFIHNKETGIFHLYDGNHRVNAMRLRGRTHVLGKVISV